MQALSNHVERREIPDEAFDVHTKEGRKRGRRWEHFVEESGKLVDPDEAAQSRGFDSMKDELEQIDAKCIAHFLARQPGGDRSSLPAENKWSEQKPPSGRAESGVKTHFVSRPLGIPLPGAATDKDEDENADD